MSHQRLVFSALIDVMREELDPNATYAQSVARPRCPCGKARYATEGEARRAVKRMKSNGRNHSYAGLLHPYMCPERKGIWHVGHTDE